MLKMAQSPDPVSIPKPAMTARTPLTMPPATSAGMIGEDVEHLGLAAGIKVHVARALRAKEGLELQEHIAHLGTDNDLPLPVFDLGAHGAIHLLQGIQVAFGIVRQVHAQAGDTVSRMGNVICAAKLLQDIGGKLFVSFHGYTPLLSH